MKRKGFQFKQFFIEHQSCAMKVGTDSIMLGSWVKCSTPVQTHAATRMLDIGTGSGLLAIMLAQKSVVDTYITAIDIDKDAINQAKGNIATSPWTNKIHAKHCSLQTFTREAIDQHKFSIIVSNPPYFNSPLTVNSDAAQKRITARQTIDLSHQTLLDCVSQLLETDGKFYCVLPSDNCPAFIAYASTLNLHLCEQLTVFSKPNSAALRGLLAFSFIQTPLKNEALTIYTQDHQYSANYKALCKDYYLNF
ncbi:tRNA1(Val) (adenine(37)-N6)-methyltransferase [Paraglaciecola polaris]|uniref:tRNA1(Val) (adenine(37)-N6)-methyltransferase n=1 Tax=Paraglaciecola polaris LMG 21857 TaxID=1129793 RepID=K6ZQ47_9ALTE|nr:methyltransferase [Paraglaciecola polaris]GAC32397.1 tRNA (adenine-N(6)-)-methyltransferase [Paraglaciecola polaris LMG 21857]|tara:strand:- start:28852 stop:29601 length:750 start_codon:yes stop_codon:yes gene_type:complete